MKIIIIGDGKVGYTLAEKLSKEQNSVTIIDKDIDALRKANENLDVMCIKGNGVSTGILIEAGVYNTDLLIAATSSDEMNMVCCLTAKRLGAKNTIARIRDPEYANELSMLKTELELNMVINPEQAAAYEIAQLLRFPPATNIESFAKGKVELVEIKVTPDLPIVGKQLKYISNKICHTILICAVVRDGEIKIPNGDFTILKDDIIHVIGSPLNITDFCNKIGKYKERIKTVMVVGGGKIAYYLAPLITEMGMKVKIIENNEKRCEELSELLPDSIIIYGDGTDEELLESENIADMDAFISLTGRDEDNLILALIAKQHLIKKIVLKINRMNYLNIIQNLALNSIISPKLIAANHIIKYVRGLKNAEASEIQTLYRIVDGKAETIEFTANKHTKFIGIPLKNLNIIKDVLLTTIVRKNKIIIPHGNDFIKEGDSVIIISKNKVLSDINQIFATGVL